MLPDVLVNHTLPVELFFIRPDASEWRSVNACHLICFGISKTDNHTLPGELFFIRPDASDWRSVNACHFMFFLISKTEFCRAKHRCISIRSCVSLPAICFRLAICECIPPSHPENSHTSKLQTNQKSNFVA